jgi:hypothetical protein
VFTDSILDGLRSDTLHEIDLAAALESLARRCREEGIPFAVVGAVAMRQHGYVRFTEDIEIVTTKDGLDRIHARLVGLGFVARAPGLRKKLRDTVHGVNLDVIQTGEHAGAPASPVVYPDPQSSGFVAIGADGIAYATLPALIAFKLASGRWGNRPRDLADVQELVKANRLEEGFAEQLPEAVREAFVERVRASRIERDIE